ncbi:sensor histidine kinase [Bacillus sp. FJAT-42376]|uniref:sensor histidine kinase n=1 Tax=Bacillus sp. FJAT-42376 TaxID=2014076 RepID=UPI000F510C64|nr:sensor histidine kinase [Bacillus sp. FJAT-42376]AZB44607.1 sensor histidine kinase [Bacillus sp. FJAT-42376]
MKSIRTKLLIYFSVFVALFNIVTFSIYFSSNRIVSEYHQSFQGFLLFNEVSQQANSIYEKINGFAVEKDGKFVREYDQLKRDFSRNMKKLETEKPGGVGDSQLHNYRNMMQSLLTESDSTIEEVKTSQIDDYLLHLKEVRNISSYIQESTLTLLNMELSEYRAFYQDMEKRNQAFQWFTISLFTSTLLLALLLALFFSRGVTRPIRQLSDAAKEIASGRFEGPTIAFTSNDEISVLGESFNYMKNNLKRLIEEIEEKSELDQLLKELELKHLQNQINPHFLFNTLNTITRMAYLEDAAVTSRLMESVSKLLRYSLGDLNKTVTLSEEASVVQEYFYIQKTRFADRITFKTEIDENCLESLIPSLTLQPLVENAFIHGVENNEDGGEITLRIFSQKGIPVIEISDNGEGMTDAQVEQIFSQQEHAHEISSGHSTGIGLRNVIRRLELFYKRKDVLQIDSKKGAGTTIRIRLEEAG